MKQTTDFDRKCSEDILAALQKNRESIDCIHKLISCKEPHTRNNMAFGQRLELQKSTNKTENHSLSKTIETAIDII